MAEAFMGEIRMFAGTFAPKDWMYCQGQVLAIQEHTALFSLLGTNYGGDGRTTFGLPDLRGRVPVGAGTGPGLAPKLPGEKSGYESTQLGLQNLPAHTHTATVGQSSVDVTLKAVNGEGSSNNPSGNALASALFGRDAVNMYSATAPTETMQGISVTATSPSVEIGTTGSGQAVTNMQPYDVVNYIICVNGIYPPRN